MGVYSNVAFYWSLGWGLVLSNDITNEWDHLEQSIQNHPSRINTFGHIFFSFNLIKSNLKIWMTALHGCTNVIPELSVCQNLLTFLGLSRVIVFNFQPVIGNIFNFKQASIYAKTPGFTSLVAHFASSLTLLSTGPNHPKPSSNVSLSWHLFIT